MKKKEKAPREKTSPLSPEFEALLRQAGESPEVLAADPGRLLEKLGPLGPGGQEEFFSRLLVQEGSSSILEALIGREEKVDLAIARALGRWNSPAAGGWLHRLAGRTSSAAAVKASRRSLFQLRSRGLEVPDLPDRGPSVYRPVQPAPAEGFLSSIDAGGTRLVWLVRPQPPQGVFVFHGLVSDTRGILDFHGFESSRKKFGEYLEGFRAEVPWAIVPADPEYCLWLIGEAAARNREEGLALPEEFLKWRDLMGSPPEPPPQPLIYRLLPAEEWKARADLRDRSAGLFALPEFQPWFLEEAETDKYLALIKEASQSRLVLTPYQQEARVLEIYRMAAEELFDRAGRSRMRRRLEEMAYVLWVTGRENESRTALAAALGMEAEAGILTAQPFLLELIRRSITARLEKEEAEKKQKESELLIRP